MHQSFDQYSKFTAAMSYCNKSPDETHSYRPLTQPWTRDFMDEGHPLMPSKDDRIPGWLVPAGVSWDTNSNTILRIEFINVRATRPAPVAAR